MRRLALAVALLLAPIAAGAQAAKFKPVSEVTPVSKLGPATAFVSASGKRISPAKIEAGKGITGLTVELIGLPSKARKGASLPPSTMVRLRAEARPGSLACLARVPDAGETLAGEMVDVWPVEGVVLVRSETLTERPEGATLSVIDAWLDARTGGLEQISRSELALTRLSVSTAMGALYAFRTNEEVRLVVPSLVGAEVHGDSGDSAVSCEFAHWGLPLRDSGAASMARVVRPPSPPPTAAPSASAAPASVEPAALQVLDIAASVSRVRRDKEPLLSVSVRLGNREGG